MKFAIRKPLFITCVSVTIFLCGACVAFAQPHGSIKLNKDAFAFASKLINDGQVTADRKGAWSRHRPSADQENEFIRLHGFSEYAKWHLGIDERFGANTKGRYKFPFGDFTNVHRCGLLAARSSARLYGYMDLQFVQPLAECRKIFAFERHLQQRVARIRIEPRGNK